MAALGVSRQIGIVSPAYGVYRLKTPDSFESKYLDHLLRTQSYAAEYRCRSTGVNDSRLRLYPESFLEIPILCPSKEEQAAIVRFLDYADRQIKRQIRAKRKLIVLLNEQKQVITHQALTRGLDSNVRLKPSGTEYLGDIPEHWSLKRFKFVAKIPSGQVDPNDSQHMVKILIAPNHIRSGSGVISHLQTAIEQGASSGKYEVRKGQIIYSKIRPNLAKAAMAPCDCLCSADMYPISPVETEVITPYFLQILLSKPFTKFATDCSLRVAMPKINRDALGECWFWFPCIEEQKQILHFIDEATKPLNSAFVLIQSEIDLLLELRARLIADVVTGKQDIREAAAHLPVLADDEEAVEELEEDLDDVSEVPDAEEVEA
nr:restriction endonuclease subunit S [Geothrix oryzisoli]